MELKTTDSPVIEKTKELCQTLLAQPSFEDIKRRIEAFAADTALRAQYEDLCDMQERLQTKDAEGIPLNDEEVDEFDKARDTLFENKIARDFMDAQQEMHKLQQTVSQYISKTFKLGRVPEESDFEAGKCGPRCGCSG